MEKYEFTTYYNFKLFKLKGLDWKNHKLITNRHQGFKFYQHFIFLHYYQTISLKKLNQYWRYYRGNIMFLKIINNN